MRSVRAFKLAVQEPARATIRPKGQGVFHRIDVVGEVKTPNGIMIAVKLRQKWDLNDPTADVAALVGTINLSKRMIDPQLWLWNDKFWSFAYDQGGNQVYYKNQTHLFYEIVLENEDDIYKSLTLT